MNRKKTTKRLLPLIGHLRTHEHISGVTPISQRPRKHCPALSPLILLTFLSLLIPVSTAAAFNSQHSEIHFIEAEQTEAPKAVEDSGIFPAPRPFTLNIYDARMAEALLERVGLVELRTGEDSTRIVKVRKVRIEYVAENPELPEPYRKRFDIRLNGRPLEWNKTYIKYDFRMVNMRLLFTYRNERPVPNVPYYLHEWGN